MLNKQMMDKAIEILAENYPKARPQLEYESDYQLLVAVILSAQCTDKRVNIVTQELFKNYGTAQTMLAISQSQLEEIIKPCGLFRMKAKHILQATSQIVECFDGKVPRDFDTLLKLSGVGRKTANVVYSVAMGGDAIAVDTHVFRVSKRIGLSDGNSPFAVEMQLRKNVSKSIWSKAHHYLIFHGRNICKAINPLCSKCPLCEICEKNGVVKSK